MIRKLPRCPGFRYGPRVVSFDKAVGVIPDEKWWRVQQKGWWGHASVVGPFKPTREEAVKAWARLVKTIRANPPNPQGSPGAAPVHPAVGRMQDQPDTTKQEDK
jgi:hypothetical protein